MARDIFVNGETMVFVKGAAGSGIASYSQLGLADAPIVISPQDTFLDIKVDAWGAPPPEVQHMNTTITISMSLIHFDRTVLDYCIQESMGGAAAVGTLTRAGTRLGNGGARFASNNHFIGLNLASPVAGKPWRFYYTHLAGNPYSFPLGSERSAVNLTWRAVPYISDPWNSGNGAQNVVMYDHVLDS